MQIKNFIPSTPIRDMMRPLYLIVPAAGLGTRMGISDSKQFLKINGIPVLARTLLAFAELQENPGLQIHAVVVTGEENIGRVEALLQEYKISFVEKVVPGGATRQDSVACGIAALSDLERVPEPQDPVFIHDGARCMVDKKTIAACYAGGQIYDVCVAATPCKNTIKMATAESVSSSAPAVVDRTLDRSTLYEVQTPQVFKYGVLLDVSARAKESGITATDDTALAEALGIPVRLIPCSYGNIKITTPEDAALAEFMLKERG
ncbi:MAG: 2-C-methyl-D-erythritol 4-phosphate cytidylyltransferase [Clostridiales bacterium]|nr:2-C-methyl-D-erythritol 4-phosphate cytidylyltransferase [Clostridiales bacterium]